MITYILTGAVAALALLSILGSFLHVVRNMDHRPRLPLDAKLSRGQTRGVRV
jgi:hypothetical protein